MKRIILVFALLFTFSTLLVSCNSCQEEKTADEKVEEAIEELGDDLENASDDVQDAVEDVQDEVEEAIEEADSLSTDSK